MSVIPCEQDAGLRRQIERFAEVLKTQAHKLGDHEINHTSFDVAYHAEEAMRRTTNERGGTVQHSSEMTAIRRG